MDVRVSLAVDLVERLLEDCKGIRDPVGEPEGAAQLDGDVAASRRDGQDLESGPQVVDRGRPVRQPLGEAELDEHLCPPHSIGLLLERAGEIFDSGISCALSE